MNVSPYFTGAAPNFGPPSGMAALINSQQNSQMDTHGFQQFYDVAQQYKQIQAQGKAADATVAAYPNLLKSAGMSPEQFQTLGARDKAAVVSGVVQAQAQKNVVQQYADIAAQARERDAQTAALSDTGDFLRAYAAPLASGAEDTPQNRLAAGLTALRPGADIGRVFPQAMNSLEKFAAVGANGSNPQFSANTNLVPGWTLTGMKGSKQWQALPTGGANVQMVDDGNGNQVPVIVGPKGTVTQVKSGTKDLNPKDALTAYNNNAKRLAELSTSLQMAQDPKYSSILDKAAIQAEMDGLQQEQSTLKPIWQKTARAPGAPSASAIAPPAAVAYLRANPSARGDFDKKFGVGASATILGN